ncbi:thioredoxin domain-containing protein [Streptomyces solisilvae]|uniref:thioredoxin domain-containing protein n=1 Tax=Streptomyces malaysiensis TaxID=92644 RepID=UPI003698D94E
MSTMELTADNFNQVIFDNDFVITDFWAEWCGPSAAPAARSAAVFERVSDKHEDVSTAADKNQ